jgi:hypothetical protein
MYDIWETYQSKSKAMSWLLMGIESTTGIGRGTVGRDPMLYPNAVVATASDFHAF